MAFREFSEDEFQHVRCAVEDVRRIKRRAQSVMEGVKAVLESAYPKENWGVDLQLGNDGFVDISSPYGKARARLLLSIDDDGPRGRYLIEKSIINRLDQSEWRPVWAIRLDKAGIYAGDESTRPLDFSGFHSEEQYGELALSILYAIARGPVE